MKTACCDRPDVRDIHDPDNDEYLGTVCASCHQASDRRAPFCVTAADPLMYERLRRVLVHDLIDKTHADLDRAEHEPMTREIIEALYEMVKRDAPRVPSYWTPAIIVQPAQPGADRADRKRIERMKRETYDLDHAPTYHNMILAPDPLHGMRRTTSVPDGYTYCCPQHRLIPTAQREAMHIAEPPVSDLWEWPGLAPASATGRAWRSPREVAAILLAPTFVFLLVMLGLAAVDLHYGLTNAQRIAELLVWSAGYVAACGIFCRLDSA